MGKDNIICVFNIDDIKRPDGVEIKRKELDLDLAVHKKVFPNQYSMRTVKWGYLNERIYIANEKGFVEVLDDKLKTLKTERVFEKQVNSFTFSKHFDFFVVTSDNGAKVFSTDTMELVTELRSDYPINCAQLSPLMYRKENPRFHVIMGGGIKARDTAFAKEGGLDIMVMNAIQGAKVCTLSGHYGPINWIECCPDGGGFVSAGEEAIVRYYRFDKKYHETEEFD